MRSFFCIQPQPVNHSITLQTHISYAPPLSCNFLAIVEKLWGTTHSRFDLNRSQSTPSSNIWYEFLLCSVWFFIFTFFLCNIFLLLLFFRLSLSLSLSIIEVIITIAFSFFRFKIKSTEFEWWRFNSHSAENYTKAKKYVVTFWTLLNSQSIYPFVCPTVHPSIHPSKQPFVQVAGVHFNAFRP